MCISAKSVQTNPKRVDDEGENKTIFLPKLPQRNSDNSVQTFT